MSLDIVGCRPVCSPSIRRLSATHGITGYRLCGVAFFQRDFFIFGFAYYRLQFGPVRPVSPVLALQTGTFKFTKLTLSLQPAELSAHLQIIINLAVL